MIPQVFVFDSEEELDAFLNSLGVPCQAEEPKKESQKGTFANLGRLSDFLESVGAAQSYQELKQETTSVKQLLTGGKVNYYSVDVGCPNNGEHAYVAECGDIIDALQLTFNEANIVKEIWRTANARLGKGKPGNTALYGAEKVAYYANRILEAEKQKA